MPSASEVIEKLPDQLKGKEVTVSDVMDEMNGRSLLLTILILIVPNLLPFVNALGITYITGILLLIFTTRMMIGSRTPWLPGWVKKLKTKRKNIRSMSEKAVPVFKTLEKFIKPRAQNLVSGKIRIFYAFLLFLMTIVLLLPIPFINVLPALIMTIITLGMIQRDGIVAATGGILAIILAAAIVYAVFAVGSSGVFTDKDAFFDYETFQLINL